MEKRYNYSSPSNIYIIIMTHLKQKPGTLLALIKLNIFNQKSIKLNIFNKLISNYKVK